MALQQDGTFNLHRQQNQWVQSTFESDRINSVFRLYQSMVLALTQGEPLKYLPMLTLFSGSWTWGGLQKGEVSCLRQALYSEIMLTANNIGYASQMWKLRSQGNCDPRNKVRDRYRNIDGQCNNLANQDMGKSFTPTSRFLPNAYEGVYCISSNTNLPSQDQIKA